MPSSFVFDRISHQTGRPPSIDRVRVGAVLQKHLCQLRARENRELQRVADRVVRVGAGPEHRVHDLRRRIGSICISHREAEERFAIRVSLIQIARARDQLLDELEIMVVDRASETTLSRPSEIACAPPVALPLRAPDLVQERAERHRQQRDRHYECQRRPR